MHNALLAETGKYFANLQWRNKGAQFSRRRITVGGCLEGPTMSQVLSSIEYICFQETSGSNMGCQNSCPGPHLALLRHCQRTNVAIAFHFHTLQYGSIRAISSNKKHIQFGVAKLRCRSTVERTHGLH